MTAYDKKKGEQDAIEFLRQMEVGLPPEERLIVVYAEEATVQTDENGKKINAGFWPKPYKTGKYIPSESNAYACISSSIKTMNPKTKEMRYWRGEMSFGHGNCFFVDDIGTGTGSKGNMTLEWLEGVLPPTAVVETSPNNYQAWYFFDKPINQMQEFKAFLYNFVNAVLEGAGGDVTIKDVARIGRMPYGINNKRLPDGSFKYMEDGKPYRVRLHSSDYSRRYSLDDIANAFKFERTALRAGMRDLDAEEEAEAEARLLAMAKAEGNEEFLAAIEEKNKLKRKEEECNNVWYQASKVILDDMEMGEGSDGRVVENQSGKCRIMCPWGGEHSNGDQYGAYFRARIPGAEFNYVFGCGHDTCRKENKRTWAVFTDYIVLDRIYDNLSLVNETWCNEAKCEYISGVLSFTDYIPARKIDVAFPE